MPHLITSSDIEMGIACDLLEKLRARCGTRAELKDFGSRYTDSMEIPLSLIEETKSTACPLHGWRSLYTQ